MSMSIFLAIFGLLVGFLAVVAFYRRVRAHLELRRSLGDLNANYAQLVGRLNKVVRSLEEMSPEEREAFRTRLAYREEGSSRCDVQERIELVKFLRGLENQEPAQALAVWSLDDLATWEEEENRVWVGRSDRPVPLSRQVA